MCGIVAILLADRQAHCRKELFDGLLQLQHRGQDAAGIVTALTTTDERKEHWGTKLNQVKGLGMVRDVFTLTHMLKLKGNVGIGHCRYPTAGSTGGNPMEAQPFYNNYPCGLALAHNGNLTNSSALSMEIRRLHHHLNTQSDSEAMLSIFAEALRKELDLRDEHLRTDKIEHEMIFKAVNVTMSKCKGGYAVVILIHDVGVVAFRDPHGIRPLCYGSRRSTTYDKGIDYIFASESGVVDSLGYTYVGDVKPGECILSVPLNPEKPRADCGLIKQQMLGDGSAINTHPCLFEYVYFARDDSEMNGVSIKESRMSMGRTLGRKILKQYPEHEIDIVMPIPETSRTAALAVAQVLGVEYGEGLTKNSYIGRTFIMPGQATRKKNVRLKLNPTKRMFAGKRVLLVDDSVVRGTTSREIVQMSRTAGADKVYFASAAPPIRYQNVYGIDLPTKTELVAHGRTEEQVAAEIGADWMCYQSLGDLEDSIRELNPSIKTFENSTFSGKYITGDVDESYFAALHIKRKDSVRINASDRFTALDQTKSPEVRVRKLKHTDKVQSNAVVETRSVVEARSVKVTPLLVATLMGTLLVFNLVWLRATRKQ